MRADGYNTLEYARVQRLNIGRRLKLEQVVVPRAARRVTGALFVLAENGKIDPGRTQQSNERTHYLLRA